MLSSLLNSSGLTVEWVGGCGFPFFNLYRMASIVRGEKLIEETSVGEDGLVSSAVRFSSWVFRGLFQFNVTRSRWGWQIAGVARMPQSSQTKLTQPGATGTTPDWPTNPADPIRAE